MNGKPTINSINSTPPVYAPQVPSSAPSPNGDVIPHTGQRYTPDSPSVPQKSIHSRTAEVQQDVQARVNRQSLINNLTNNYLKHHAQAVAIDGDLKLAKNIAAIKYFLANPVEAKKSSSLVVVWVPDDGSDSVRVIPPDTKMQQQEQLATELKQKLGDQLTKLESKFVPSKIKELRQQRFEQVVLRNHFAEKLRAEDVTPTPPASTHVAVIGASHISTPIIATPSKVIPETGQAAAETAALTTPSAASSPKLNGSFKLQLEPGTADQPSVTGLNSDLVEPLISIEDGEEEEESLISIGGGGDGEEEEDDLYGLPTGEPVHRPDQSSYEPVNETFWRAPLRETGSIKGADPSVKSDPDAIASTSILPRPSKQHSTSLSNVSWNEPSVNPTQPSVRYSILGAGQDSVHADLFRPAGHLETGGLASVNAGNDNLYFDDKGINGRFKEELNDWEDVSTHEAVHTRMWMNCRPGDYHVSEAQDLKYVPGLKASFMYRSPLSEKKSEKKVGTVIIDVFKEPYPNGNPANKAMIYVVPPDGQRGLNEDEFKRLVKSTASNIVQTLHAYNTYAKSNDLPDIPDLRVCGFSSGKNRHPNVPKEVVGQCIENGIRRAVAHIQQVEPLSVRNIEFANGSGGAFQASSAVARPEKSVIEPFGASRSVEPAFGESLVDTSSSVWSSQVSTDQSLAQDKDWADFSQGYSAQSVNSVPGNTPPQVAKPSVLPSAVSPQSPTAPSSQAEILQNPPETLVRALEHQKDSYAAKMLAQTRQPSASTSAFSLNSAFNSPVHTVRKAQMARVLLNFHRGCSAGKSDKEAALIPANALPLVELGVLCSRSSSSEILEGKGSRGNAHDARARLMSLSLSNELATELAEAVNGVSFYKKGALSSVMRDVERLETMRNVETFDVADLECYRQYGDEAKRELVKICMEYKDMLSAQEDIAAKTLMIKEGSQEIGRYPGSGATSKKASLKKLADTNTVYGESLTELKRHSHLRQRFEQL